MSSDLLLHNCSIIDATRADALVGGAVWISDNKIAAAGTEADVRDALGDRRHQVMDLGGRFLSPGLINMHTHLSLSLPGPRGAEIKSMSAPQLVLHMADGAARTLQCGVTTIRCVGEKDHADFPLKASIEAGKLQGPRMFTAGRPICCTGGHGHGSSGGLECDGATGFRQGVRQQIRAGADFVKVMISGGLSGQHEEIHTRQVTRDELEAAITTAHEWGRKITAHAGPAPIIAEAVELGLDCVEHGYQLTDEVTAAMAEKGCALVPTLVVTRCKSFFDELGVPEWMQQRALSAGERHMQSFRSAVAAGVTVMLGSDMPPFWTFEGTSAAVRELEHMSEGALGAKAALAAATIVPAQWLRADDMLGTVEVGKYADLIVTDGDPSLDTSTYRTLSVVVKDGVIVRDDLSAVYEPEDATV
ncbi:amidohydrolase [Rhodococcus sp. 06-621-2]|nr:amidohydrolase family protein [Rhodococcus sp. 06-621-2]OZC55592.1 amidohydrolase [Rhodococcus sp. 06-621-2]